MVVAVILCLRYTDSPGPLIVWEPYTLDPGVPKPQINIILVYPKPEALNTLYSFKGAPTV